MDFKRIDSLQQQVSSTDQILQEKDKTIADLKKERDEVAADFFQLIDENEALKDRLNQLQEKVNNLAGSATAAEVKE